MENNTSFTPEFNFNYNEPQPRAAAYTAAPAPAAESASKNKKRGGFVKLVAVALCCSLLGGVAGTVLASRGGTTAGTAAEDTTASRSSSSVSTVLEGQRTAQAVTVAHAETGELKTAAEVYAENVNSTVGITTSISTNYFGYRTSAAASGSGFIITSDGYIVTNHHVIEDSDSITVTTYNGDTYDAVLVGSDEDNDLAVLKIDANNLTPVILGDSDSLVVGEDVVAIGNPLGELTFSMTGGMVSALGREITLSSGVTMTLIQTDAAINSGNSGGALFNMYGEVVGITNAKYSSSGSSSEASIDNIGFAIPISGVKNLIKSIMENGYAAKPYIGVSVGDGDNGALVASVSQGSPAETAGLQENDVITAANGTQIKDASALVALVRRLNIGDTLKLTVLRGEETLELTLTVGEKPQTAAETDPSSGTYDPYENYGGYGYGYGNDFGDIFGGYGNGYGYGYGYGDSYGSGSPRF